MMAESFLGRENHGLLDELLPDLPGILNWAIAGWRRLAERGHFSLPKASSDAMRDLADLASPISAFVRDECELNPNASIPKAQLFEAWRRSCASRGDAYAGTLEVFGRNLTTVAPGRVRPAKCRQDGGRVTVYMGIRLRRDAPLHENPPF